jgi:putative endonuclease
VNGSTQLTLPTRLDETAYESASRFYTYILASKRNGALYVGLTTDLIGSVCQHRLNQVEGITKLYNVQTLVFYESHRLLAGAKEREKQLKQWHRKWKLELIETVNPDWRDLYADIIGRDDLS